MNAVQLKFRIMPWLWLEFTDGVCAWNGWEKWLYRNCPKQYEKLTHKIVLRSCNAAIVALKQNLMYQSYVHCWILNIKQIQHWEYICYLNIMTIGKHIGILIKP